MQLRKVCAAVLLGAAQISPASAEWSAGLVVNADVERQTHANEQGERAFQKGELTLRPRFDIVFSERWSSRWTMRIRSDSEDVIEPGEANQDARSSYNRRWAINDRTDIEVRDLYVDGKIGNAMLRIGKQQIVWGQADGLRVLDVVNPFSFREFVIADAEERRIPLWSVRADLPIGSSNLQWVWLLDPTYDDIPEANAAFAITTPLLIPRASPGANVLGQKVTRPASTVRNSDAGLRWSTNTGGWDLSANYLYHYYDDPIPAIESNGATVTVVPRYERTHLIGGTFANAFGSTTLRGEVGYSTNRWFITTDATEPHRVIQSPELSWVIGVDNLSFTNTLLSMQYFQSSVVDSARLTRDKAERQITALVQRRFANDSITLRALGLYSVNRRDAGVQARVSWALGTHWTVAASIDNYSGDREGLFGEFHQASRWGLHLEWGT